MPTKAQAEQQAREAGQVVAAQEVRTEAAPVHHGIIDRNNREDPTYAYAGANMGGDQVTVCDVCGGLVLESWQRVHGAFHRRLRER